MRLWIHTCVTYRWKRATHVLWAHILGTLTCLILAKSWCSGRLIENVKPLFKTVKHWFFIFRHGKRFTGLKQLCAKFGQGKGLRWHHWGSTSHGDIILLKLFRPETRVLCSTIQGCFGADSSHPFSRQKRIRRKCPLSEKESESVCLRESERESERERESLAR